MGVKVNWGDPEQHSIRYEFDEKWSWDELFQACLKARAMERSAGQHVDVILDVSGDSLGLDPCQFVANNMFIYRLAQRHVTARGSAGV